MTELFHLTAEEADLLSNLVNQSSILDAQLDETFKKLKNNPFNESAIKLYEQQKMDKKRLDEKINKIGVKK